MPIVRASYLALLRKVASHCSIPYASVICEVAEDGLPVYGIEVDLPCDGLVNPCRRLFFWSRDGTLSDSGYEQAALQAIAFLQKKYGFVVVDYNFTDLIVKSALAGAAVTIAAKAVTMLRDVARGSEELILQSDQLMKEINCLDLCG